MVSTSLLNATDVTGAERPNIIFILADDLGWKDVGFAGGEFFETPHIDRLAGQGLSFTAGYSGGPNCAPTRACLMSGTYSPRHQIYTPGGRSKGNPAYMRLLVPAVSRKDQALKTRAASMFRITNELDPDFVCIPEVLESAGYTSARLGKWHLGADTQGFDLSSSDGKRGPEGSFYGNVDVAEQLTDRALQFIEENREGPFFLYLAHWDVHVPHRARESIVNKYKAKLNQLPADQRKRFNPVYAAMIEAVDTSVGRVTAKVDELGIAENTLLIFTSDNGGLPGVSQLDPLRGQKGSLFEAGIRVPMCARWTGRIDANSTCDTPVTSVDFLPTLAALAGATLPTEHPIDGTDISPLLNGETIEERGIFWHFPLYLQGKGLTISVPGNKTYSWRGFPSTAMRAGKWKAIHFFETQTVAIYDLERDPGELNDLSSQHPKIAERLSQQIFAWQKSTRAPIPSEPNPECVLRADPPGT